MATQMQLKVLFGRKSHGRPVFYEEKTTTKSCLLELLFMFTLTWIKEKELGRVIENKGDEFRRKTWKFKEAVRKCWRPERQ